MPETFVRPPRFATLVLLSGLSVVSINMFVPSLANMAADFGVDYALMNLSVAGYAAVTAVLQLIMGPASDRFGRRPVILTGLLIFCLASLGCALATDITTFLVFRMLQAAIVSAFAVSRAVIRDTAGPQKAASLMGYLAVAWAVAPMLGPMFGGALDELFGWRASFWAFLCCGAMVFALSWFDLRETNQSPSATLRAQLRTYPELFRARRFWGYALCLAFCSGGFYAFLAGAPLVAAVHFDMSAATLGAGMGSITAGFIFGSFLSGRLAARHALTTMMIAGRLVACAGLLTGILLVSAGIVHVFTVFGACVFFGIGNGITMPSGTAGALSVRPALAGSASGLSGALTVAGGATTSAVTGAVLTAETAAYGLLGMMLLCAALGLAAALYVLWVDKRRARIVVQDG